MNEITFSWDPQKNSENQRKHDVSFEEGPTVFFDDDARLIGDPDHSDEEDRYILLGMSLKLRILVVCHCYRQCDHEIRIISARKARPGERRQYEEFKNEKRI
jgi:uncharacterized DUF497 family protein